MPKFVSRTPPGIEHPTPIRIVRPIRRDFLAELVYESSMSIVHVTENVQF